MLDRYTHRHDSVLAPIFEILKKHKPDSVEMFADLEGCSTSGGTIPADTLLTNSRPDTISIDRRCTPAKVTLLELTVPWDSAMNFDSYRTRDRYEFLALDIESRGCKCNNMPLEIWCRGVINQRNRNIFFPLCQSFNIRCGISLLKTLLNQLLWIRIRVILFGVNNALDPIDKGTPIWSATILLNHPLVTGKLSLLCCVENLFF